MKNFDNCFNESFEHPIAPQGLPLSKAVVQVNQIEKEIMESPSAMAYYKLIFLYKKMNNYEKFEEVIQTALRSYPLSEEIWKEYVKYKESVSSTFEEKYAVLNLIKCAFKDFYYTKLIIKHLKLLISLNKTAKDNKIDIKNYPDITYENIVQTFKKYLKILGMDIKYSDKLYDLYLNFLENKDDEIYNTYLARLKIPQITLDIVYKEYCNWEKNPSRKEKIDKVYQSTTKNVLSLTYFDDEFNNADSSTIVELIKSNTQLLEKINPEYVTLYYEKALQKYVNDSDLWKDYYSYKTKENYSQFEERLEIVSRAKRFCKYDTYITILYLRLFEIVYTNDIELTNAKINELVNDAINSNDGFYICELKKYLIEFMCRNYKDKDEQQLVKIRELFKNMIIVVDQVNMNEQYENTIYHIWAEFECYKAKSSKYLMDIMDHICTENPNIHNYRAYLYYIKSVGTCEEIRKIYKEAYDSCADERELLKVNWLSWEKSFGSALTISNAIMYTKNSYEPESEKSKASTVIIRGLPDEVDEAALHVFLSQQYSLIPISDIRLIRDTNGNSRNFAFIDYTTEKDAEVIVSSLNNTIYPNTPCILHVAIADQKGESRTVFVADLPNNTKEEDIRESFSKYGEIFDVRIIVSKNTKKQKGYCYVEFTKAESAKKAVQDENVRVNNKKVVVEMSKSFDKMKKDMKNKITIYVKNLSFKMSDEELRKYVVEECGVDEENVLGATICRDGSKKSKGYGFIDVRWRDDADKILKKSGESVMGRNIIFKSGEKGEKKDKDRDEEEVVLINKKRRHERPLKNSDFKKFFN